MGVVCPFVNWQKFKQSEKERIMSNSMFFFLCKERKHILYYFGQVGKGGCL
jgi:hypothetical protein